MNNLNEEEMSFNNDPQKGITPPNSVEFEKLVLGACLIDSRGKDTVLNIFKEKWEMFYSPKHQEIFKAIHQLTEKNEPVDLMTVIQELKKTNKLEKAGGDRYIIELSMCVSSSAHIEYHSRIISEKFFLRKMAEISTKITKMTFDTDADSLSILDRFTFEIGGIYDYIAG